jgi:transcription elongation GreA/GreB family factor
MSRAFVKDTEDQTAALPDRPVSPHRNFVTGERLRAIENALGRFEEAQRAAIDKGDKQAAAAALREVRYWRARHASAEVVERRPSHDQAEFGATVTLRRDDGREQTFRIVGEDEANPAQGTISYVSPLAQAVLGHGLRGTVEIAGRGAIILNIRQ